MNLLFWGITIGTIGKVILGAGVLMAHSEIAKEHRIDASVLRVFRTERWLTLLGLFLIIVGYAAEMYFYGFLTELLTCKGASCTTAVGNAFIE